MSTSDRILLLLHIGFAIFTLGPLTAATMSTPRYIRKRNVVVVRYLHRTTQIYGIGTLGIFLIGLGLAKGDLAEVWLTVSMTLFVVALVLLLIVERDQRKAVHLLEVAAAEAAPAAVPVRPAAAKEAKEPEEPEEPGETGEAVGGATEAEAPAAGPAADTGEIAQVERGRLAAMSGVVALIWLVILALMVWNG
ncbi:putative membrane protein [Actinomadura luteofluorescens]|uniref:Putative membrane protein n=1 Tax=Actinomadura luteofluorescens TaxID=46163 RepID=A0A7Y9EG51_9ACTN|nr:hypothetical protein [Actinomadura luteofluorescens]NYD46775.1 putative membrane protein [Actinomadura luteofluorescens]